MVKPDIQTFIDHIKIFQKISEEFGVTLRSPV